MKKTRIALWILRSPRARRLVTWGLKKRRVRALAWAIARRRLRR